MGKGIKKIILGIICIVLVGTFVYGIDKLDDYKVKIEEIKLEDGTTQYYIYKLSEVTTDKKIDDKISELNDMSYNFEDCIRLEDLQDIDCKVMNEKDLEKCKEAWRMFCEAEEYRMNEKFDLKIKELNEKKLELEAYI